MDGLSSSNYDKEEVSFISSMSQVKTMGAGSGNW